MSDNTFLFLIACSNGKQRGGEHRYIEGNSIANMLPEHSKKLFNARRQIYSLIKVHKIRRNGVILADLPYNAELVQGKDFGLDDSNGKYLEAIMRYQGRFYRELSKEGDDPVELVKKSSHHLLIISGLYGLLTPLEPIQCYSCHINDHPSIAEVWKKDDILTSLLLAYMKKFNIKILIDIIAASSHRNLLNWEKIHNWTKKQNNEIYLFQAFGSQNVGAALLPALGSFMRNVLKGKEEISLSDLKQGKTFFTEFEDIKFTRDGVPPEGYPTNKPQEEIEDTNDSYLSDTFKKNKQKEKKADDQKARLQVTSGEDTTIFKKKITCIDDLPPEVKPIFRDLETYSEIIRVKFTVFKGKLPKSVGSFFLSLREPEKGSGVIFGKLKGPGKIGGFQNVRIEVKNG
ncbi:MAG: peroxide stress protein YaaA, partial [Methanothermobacter tenebrarum]